MLRSTKYVRNDNVFLFSHTGFVDFREEGVVAVIVGFLSFLN